MPRILDRDLRSLTVRYPNAILLKQRYAIASQLQTVTNPGDRDRCF
ncbi:hypothetical protein [Argonema galeatum]|nr:hypothetical protein [Argonema galeatum]MCL1464157.1 hypothetical protein [Argonema galeatum A003/A1]